MYAHIDLDLLSRAFSATCETKQPEIESLNREITGNARFDFTLTHAFFLRSGAVVVKTRDRVRRSIHHPVLSALPGEIGDYPSKLLAPGCPALFSISQEEILDKSKANIASKAITLLQTFWFALQVISRAAQHLAISTLEIFTISIVASSLLSTLLWWNKPKDVSTQTVIRIDMTNEELEQVLAGPRPDYSPGELRASKAIYLFAVFASFSASVPLLAFCNSGWEYHMECICYSTIACLSLCNWVFPNDRLYARFQTWWRYLCYFCDSFNGRLCPSATLLCYRSFHRPTLVSSRPVWERGLVFVLYLPHFQ